MIILSNNDIINLNITQEEIIEAIEKVLILHTNKKTIMSPKKSIIPKNNEFFTSMPCYISSYNLAGIKWISRCPDNKYKNLPKIIGSFILNDSKTGILLAFMDANWITAMRTGAIAGLTVKYCASKNSKVLSIIGAGVHLI